MPDSMQLTLPSLVLAAVLAVGACSDNTASTGPIAADEVILTSVSPAGGSTGVDPVAPVVAEFNRSMAEGMETYCALHDGGLGGPEVPGRWGWSEGHHRLMFTPDQPLEQDHDYTLHLGGGLRDMFGHHMNFEQYGHMMGGQWVDEGMFGPGGGMMDGGQHAAGGWRHQNGSFGMSFSFRTGS